MSLPKKKKKKKKKRDLEQLFRFYSLVPLIERDYIIILFISLLKFFLRNNHELVSLIINEYSSKKKKKY